MKKKNSILIFMLILFGAIMTLLGKESAYADGPPCPIVQAGDADTLKQYLSSPQDYIIELTANISQKQEGNYDYWCIINGTKDLRMGNYVIDVYNDWAEDTTLFRVSAGATLYLNALPDSTSHITFHGYINENGDVKVRDLFDVYGTLFVNGGCLEAGRSKREWIHLPFVGSGYYWKQINGTAINAMYGGKVVVNSGLLIGRGYLSAGMTAKSGSTVLFNNGTVQGRGWADCVVFDNGANIRIAAGNFERYPLSIFFNGGFDQTGLQYGSINVKPSHLAEGAEGVPESGFTFPGKTLTVRPAGSSTFNLSTSGGTYTGSSGNGYYLLDWGADIKARDFTLYYQGITQVYHNSEHAPYYTWEIKDGDQVVARLDNKKNLDTIKIPHSFSGFSPQLGKLYTISCTVNETLKSFGGQALQTQWHYAKSIDIMFRDTNYASVPLNQTYFPDAVFRNYLKTEYDTDKDGVLSPGEIEVIYKISLNDSDLVSLEGIQYLYQVQNVFVIKSKLTKFDGKGLRVLLRLDVSQCPITSLDVSTNSNLRYLCMEDTTGRIAHLSFPNHPRLEQLYVNYPGLQSVDVSNCPLILDAILYGKQEPYGSMIFYRSDKGVFVRDRYLSMPTIYLADFNKAFPSAGFREAVIKYYDYDKDGRLTYSEAKDVKFLDLNQAEDRIKSLKGVELLFNLETLYADDCRVSEMDFSKNKKLKDLDVHFNLLTELDVSACTELTELTFGYNQIKKLKLPPNNKIEKMHAEANRLTSLETADLPNIRFLYVADNQFQSLNLSAMPLLESLNISGTSISELDLSQSPNLRILNCVNTNLSELDISQTPLLLDVYRNGAKSEKIDNTYGIPVWEYMLDQWNKYLIVGKEQKIHSGEAVAGKPGWLKTGGHWYYLNADGSAVTGWKEIKKVWYYFDDKGVMVTGWKSIGGKWYYLDTSGAMVTGWKRISEKWYYFNPSGTMVTGWKRIGEKWYYFNPSGTMAMGWKRIEEKWYYFNSSGAMVIGWQKIGGVQYYFKSNGVMAANEWVGGYWLNPNGSWTYKYKASWKKGKKGWWYGDTNGWFAKNCTITIDGKSYTFDAKGYLK